MARTVAITMVKNEADIIAATVSHMLGQVDEVIVADNGSTDGTRDILAGLPVTLLDDPDPAYYQARKMTHLAQLARTEHDADWIVPFDADEWWMSPFGTVAEICQQATGQYALLPAALYDHVATGADDPDQPDPVVRLGWRRREPAPLPKVAVAAAETLHIHMGNHGADYGPFTPNVLAGRLIVRHFPYRSPEQFVAKARTGAAALAATDLPEHVGKHWRDYSRLTDAQLHDVFAEYFHTAAPARDRTLIYDPAP